MEAAICFYKSVWGSAKSPKELFGKSAGEQKVYELDMCDTWSPFLWVYHIVHLELM